MAHKMTRLTRICSALVLSFALVLTGQGMAMARGMSPAVDAIVICTGHGPVVMSVDADGNPTAPAHLCPDCAMNLLQGVLSQGVALTSFAGWEKIKAHYRTVALACPGPRAAHARDPPWGL